MYVCMCVCECKRGVMICRGRMPACVLRLWPLVHVATDVIPCRVGVWRRFVCGAFGPRGGGVTTGVYCINDQEMVSNIQRE